MNAASRRRQARQRDVAALAGDDLLDARILDGAAASLVCFLQLLFQLVGCAANSASFIDR